MTHTANDWISTAFAVPDALRLGLAILSYAVLTDLSILLSLMVYRARKF